MALRPLLPFQTRALAQWGDPFLTLHCELNRLFGDVFRSSWFPRHVCDGADANGCHGKRPANLHRSRAAGGCRKTTSKRNSMMTC